MQPGEVGAGAREAAAPEARPCDSLPLLTEGSTRGVLNALPALLWISDAGGAVVFVNDAWLEFTGSTPECELGDGWATHVHPDDRASCVAAFRDAVSVRQRFEREYRLLRHDGEYRWMFESGGPWQQPDGAFGGYIGACLDITGSRVERERERASLELALLQQGALLQAIPDPAWLKDAGGRYLAVNEAFARTVGRHPAEIVGRVARDVFPADVAEVLEQEDRDVLASGRPLSSARCSMEAHGARWYETITSPFYGANGTLAGAAGILRDITTRREADDSVAQSNALLLAIIDASPLAIIASDLSQCAVLWNPAAERLYGWSAAEMIGRPVTCLVPPELLAEYGRQREQTVHGTPPRQAESWRLRKDGTRFPVSISYAPMRGPTGEPIGVMAIADDVSERRLLEDQLRQSHRLEAVGRLAGGIAHDFNNVLTVIIATAELLLGGFSTEDPRRGEVAEVLRAAHRAATLTRQLLAFSRQQPYTPEIVDLGAVVTDLQSLLVRLLGEHITLSCEADPGCIVVADRGQLEQVVMNLAVNARDAMRTGGALEIRVRRLTESAVPPLEAATAGVVALTVHDTGPGIPASALPYIFEPFFTTKEPGSGTGLGLATVYGIVTRAGGRVEVDSAPALGTTFRVLLPLTTDAAPVPRPDPAPAGAGSGERILLVDDEPVIARTIRRLLEKLGYRVEDSPSPVHAAELLATRGHEIDLLLSDVVMPGLSGPALVEAARARGWHGPVLFMSGYAGEFLPEGPLPERTAVIEKPFEPEELLQKLRGLLSRPT